MSNPPRERVPDGREAVPHRTAHHVWVPLTAGVMFTIFGMTATILTLATVARLFAFLAAAAFIVGGLFALSEYGRGRSETGVLTEGEGR